MENRASESLKVVMIPWLAHGHISPFQELAKKLSNTNFSVYFCSTPIILNSIKETLSLSTNPIHLIELHLPSLPDLPPHRHTTNGLPPHLMSTLVHALEMATPTFSTILKTLNPNLLIYDINQPWAPSLASSHNIPAIHFQTSGATAISFFYRLFKHRGITYPFQEIYLREWEMKRLMLKESGNYSNKDLVFVGFESSRDILLIKSSREIEGKYIDFLSGLTKKKIVPVGPLVQIDDIGFKDHDDQYSNIFEWLSEKEESSTVFVCFGSEYYLSKEEIEEIAHGLELSNVNFIWVVRFPMGEKSSTTTTTRVGVEEALPEGFVKRVKGRGLIVEGWAPQTKILRHSSISGFLSHCGWNSILESMSFAVPIIAIPMQFDQFLNARLLAELGVGLEAIRNENGELKREEVARVIKKVLEMKIGEENSMKRKARELSEIIRVKGEEESDNLVVELSKLCEKNK